MFTVRNESEARMLVALACPMTTAGEYFAPELASEQSLENLQKFSDRLADLYARFVLK